MKFIIYFLFAINASNQAEESYANCLYQNCRDLRTKCGSLCYTDQNAVSTKLTFSSCKIGTDKVANYRLCASKIANLTTDSVKEYFECLANCYSLILISIIYLIL
ncbi:hypothetical protein pb186bvf_016878 [Paramecium bursaria]